MIENETTQNHIDIDALSAYLDGDVDSEQRKRIEGHLAGCDMCREELSELRSIVALLQQLPQVNPPRSFQLGAEHENRRGGTAVAPIVRMLPVVRTLSIAAVVAFLVVTGVFFIDHTNGNNSDHVQNAALAPLSRDETATGGTGGNAPTSQAAQDGSSSQERQETDSEQTSGSDQRQTLVDRGDAASADNSAALERPPSSAAQSAPATSVTPSPQTSLGQGAPLSAESVDNSDGDSGTSWLATSIGLGILAVILIGLWFALARMSRTRRGGVS